MNKEAFIGLILREANEVDNVETLEEWAMQKYGLQRKSPIPYDRMRSIIREIHEVNADIIDEAVNLTDEEKRELGIYKEKYKVIEIDVEMTKRTTIKVAIPEDMDKYDYGVYPYNLDNAFDCEDADFDFVEYYESDNGRYTADELREKYDDCEVWNLDDFDE